MCNAYKHVYYSMNACRSVNGGSLSLRDASSSRSPCRIKVHRGDSDNEVVISILNECNDTS